ncbi:MAG TPA: histone deacetylase family protein [Ardenticatenaceae bacterium]|nr:histone deacetylase family protein [Ardenticatenaceae bacterium]
MNIFYPPVERTHAPTFEIDHGEIVPYLETRERTRVILEALERERLGTVVPVDPPEDVAFIAAVHDGEYLAFLREFWPAWQARNPDRREVIPHTFALRGRLPSRPANRASQIGWWVCDTGTPLSANTWPVATAAANAAYLAAGDVISGARCTYALCRPPGHHSGTDMAGGFCYLNNAAIAAHALSQHGRVALVDVDFHHGNGTQQIFETRSDVFFASLHGDPERHFPYFSGFAHEQGSGPGSGYTLNVPLPPGIGDRAYLDALAPVLDRVARFDPAFVVVSLGFDILDVDPLGDFAVTVDGLHAIARDLHALARPTLVVQEGGYAVEALGRLATAFLHGIA